MFVNVESKPSAGRYHLLASPPNRLVPRATGLGDHALEFVNLGLGAAEGTELVRGEVVSTAGMGPAVGMGFNWDIPSSWQACDCPECQQLLPRAAQAQREEDIRPLVLAVAEEFNHLAPQASVSMPPTCSLTSAASNGHRTYHDAHMAQGCEGSSVSLGGLFCLVAPVFIARETYPATSFTMSRTKEVRFARWPFILETRALFSRGVVFCNAVTVQVSIPLSIAMAGIGSRSRVRGSIYVALVEADHETGLGRSFLRHGVGGGFGAAEEKVRMGVVVCRPDLGF